MNRRNLRHWLTVAACCGLAASSIGICSNSVGVFYTPVSGARVLAFSSRQDFASHPYQLQLVASLIAQRFAAISPDAR